MASTFTLSTPIVVKKLLTPDKEISILQIRQPKLKDLYGLDFAGPNATLSSATLISRLTGIRLEEISEMAASDFVNLQQKIHQMMAGQV